MQHFDGEYLRRIRKEAGFTQIEIAKRLNISRETVIAIEGNKPGTIDSLEIGVLRGWLKACGQASHSTMEEVISYVKSFLNIH